MRYHWPCGLHPESMPEFTTVQYQRRKYPGLGGAFGAGIFAGIANITKSDQSREFPLLILPRW